MGFYEVWVASKRYHGSEPLTYSYPSELIPGDVVEVPLKNQLATGIVYKKTSKTPEFTSKAITRPIDANIGRGLDLLLWLLHYYPAPSGLIAGLFVPRSFPKTIPSPNSANLVEASGNLPTLTAEQKQTINKLASLKRPATVLLHGDTGTGKTRVYIELAKQVISEGKSAIILTPEIGLTPQLVSMFEESFGNNTVVLHSKLTDAMRRDAWLKIAATEKPLIVIGPRSALYAPVKNLGLIAVDEAHDNSYKQDQAPHYVATRVAAKLANLHEALCVLGTATPKSADYHLLKAHNTPILRMQKPVHSTKKPMVKLIDRREKTAFKRSHIFSDEFIDALTGTLAKKEQALVFLNRRGTARLVVCQNCGWEAVCPNCDVPLTYHKDQHELRCHICNFTRDVPTQCEKCQSTDILFRSAGSKALWDELSKLFPNARIKRFDSDNKPAETLEAYYAAIKKGDVDILVGTQILAKGLDIPKLTFVGVPFADSSLYLPDFTADEQTFQLLTQVIGRTGRRTLPSQVVIQSYNPDNPVIKSAIKKDWQGFYDNELKERESFGMPPFTYLLLLKYAHKQPAKAKQAASELAQQLTDKFRAVSILGPSPAFYGKGQGLYHWQIVVKAKDRNRLLKIISGLPPTWRYDIDPTNLL